MKTLTHGGIMVNYQCTAACRHCLYACSPTREPGYISRDTMREACRLLVAGRCASVHIGGGEPFLNFEGLLMAVRELADAGVRLEYVETNAYWAAEAGAASRLKQLRAEGVDTLCISFDPFHAEYVAYARPLRLAKLCDETGMGYFLWKEQFLRALSRLDADTPHSRAELEAGVSPSYLADSARAYGVRLGGRAVNIESAWARRAAVRDLLDRTPCRNLLDTGHFHIDLHGYFIPPGCTGLRLPLAEVVGGIEPGKYPVFDALYAGGVAALFSLAERYGFTPDPAGYPSKCNLCFHIRRCLAAGEKNNFAELDANHYEESLKYWD